MAKVKIKSAFPTTDEVEEYLREAGFLGGGVRSVSRKSRRRPSKRPATSKRTNQKTASTKKKVATRRTRPGSKSSRKPAAKASPLSKAKRLQVMRAAPKKAKPKGSKVLKPLIAAYRLGAGLLRKPPKKKDAEGVPDIAAGA